MDNDGNNARPTSVSSLMHGMKVYLIRHAQSEENVLNLRTVTTAAAFNELLRRSHAAPLTREGEIQAQLVVEKLAGAHIERLYTSPFARTLATAAVLGEALGLIPQLVDDLREVLPRPVDEQRRSASLGRLFVQGYLEMFWPWGDGETWLVGYRRARSVWARLTSEPAAEIAVVSHRGLIALILLAVRRDRRWRILASDLSNGGVSVVERRA